MHRPEPKAVHGTVTRRLTSKIHAVVDTNGLPVRLALTAGEAHDNRLACTLLSRLKAGSMLLADRGYDADWIRALAARKGALANIPPRCNRSEPIWFSPYLYRAPNWSNGSSTPRQQSFGAPGSLAAHCHPVRDRCRCSRNAGGSLLRAVQQGPFDRVYLCRVVITLHRKVNAKDDGDLT
jgi:hypothetical protein